ncbi:MAG: DUF5667 domain-containing protein [Patescibacteria group bacterium]
MSDKELLRKIQLLKSLRVGGEPSRDFVARNREILMMQAQNSIDAKKRPAATVNLRDLRQFVSSLIPVNLNRFILRPALVVFLAFGVITSGWIASVSASLNSLPGDTLYSLKIATEKAQLVFVSGDNEARLQVELAGRRMEEVSKISENQMPNKEQLIGMAVANFNEQMGSVKESFEEIKITESAVKVTEVAKIIDRKSAEYREALVKTETHLSPAAQTQVNEAKQLVDDAGISAVAAIVQNHLDDKTISTEQEVAQKVQEKLTTVTNAVADVSAKINTASEQKTTEAGAAQPAQDAALQATATLEQAKAFLENNDVGAAIAKIAEVSTLAKEAASVAVSSGLIGSPTSTAGGVVSGIVKSSDTSHAPTVTTTIKIDTKYSAQGLGNSASDTEVTAQGIESATSVEVQAQSVGDEEIVIPETLMDFSDIRQ